MHQQNISLLCDEANRLLTLTKNLTHEMLSDSNCIIDETNDKTDFTEKGLSKIFETLNNEEVKLANKEMVIAIVGTMKAGKSTTINAIIGTEVLPNRNRPMTALPTLIRHKKGKHIPELFFGNLEPLTQLSIKIKNALNSINKEDIQGVDFDKDMNELVSQINNGTAFSQSRYEGADAIFNFLKGLNDIVRLSAALNIDFPFDAYATIEQIPVIEVEFAHLSEFESSEGQLSILDTPGPNEAGQPHLKKMLKDQLNKASAVLMVMDYTQLKSTSDAEVRDSIASISKNVPLYALVNKFDQAYSNGDDEEQIKKLVANNLMKERIQYDDVFPVSSQWGYLANRARHEIKINGKLPDLNIESNKWIRDFANAIFGKGMWDADDLEDVKSVSKRIEKVWKNSLFSAPMSKVIQAAHGKAALYALNSASSQLGVYADKYQQYFDMRSQGIKISIDKLHENVTQLQHDIELVEKAHISVKTIINTSISETSENVNNKAEAIRKDLEETVHKYFLEGKEIEKLLDGKDGISKSGKKYKEGSLRKRVAELQQRAYQAVGINNDHNASDTNDDELDFDEITIKEKDTAESILQPISDYTNKILINSGNAFTEMLQNQLDDLNTKMVDSIASTISPIKKSIQGELDSAGFNIKLTFPKPDKHSFRITAETIFNEALISDERDVTSYRRKKGLWGGICKLFNTYDWGYESYTTTENVYKINFEDLRQQLQDKIDEFIKSVLNNIEVCIKRPISEETEQFFSSFSNTIENIRASLFESISDQQRNADVQEKVKLTLDKFFKNSDAILNDSNLLKNDVQNLLGNEVASA